MRYKKEASASWQNVRKVFLHGCLLTVADAEAVGVCDHDHDHPESHALPQAYASHLSSHPRPMTHCLSMPIKSLTFADMEDQHPTHTFSPCKFDLFKHTDGT